MFRMVLERCLNWRFWTSALIRTASVYIDDVFVNLSETLHVSNNARTTFKKHFLLLFFCLEWCLNGAFCILTFSEILHDPRRLLLIDGAWTLRRVSIFVPSIYRSFSIEIRYALLPCPHACTLIPFMYTFYILYPATTHGDRSDPPFHGLLVALSVQIDPWFCICTYI